jgi:hypothetical protein
MEVRKVVRGEDATFNELVSLRSTLETFSIRKNRILSFGLLDQAFFVDLVYFLINEHEHQTNVLTAPVIGLRNETAMRRLRDLKTYVDYCVAENYLSLNIPRMERHSRRLFVLCPSIIYQSYFAKPSLTFASRDQGWPGLPNLGYGRYDRSFVEAVRRVA